MPVKRFWQSASAVPVAGGFGVMLDARPLRLPGSGALVVPQLRLAEALAVEWAEAGGGIGAEVAIGQLGLTRLAATAAERVARDPGPSRAALAKYGESDLLCYRATHPDALVERQAALWQPWLDWAAHSLGARLLVTSGITYVVQPPEALAALRARLDRIEAYGLAALGVAVPALGSLVLGLALEAGAIGAAEAAALSQLDEDFQEEQWGADTQSAVLRAARAHDVADAAQFFSLI